MKVNPSSPLVAQLRSAVTTRLELIRRGQSRRKDHANMEAALGRAETFLRSYPYASDERVREYCKANYLDLSVIVPGNNPRALARLVFDELKTNHHEQGGTVLRESKRKEGIHETT